MHSFRKKKAVLTGIAHSVNVSYETDVHCILRDLQLPSDRCSLARVIEAETGIKPVLIHSPDIGAFEVTVNDELIFSKGAVGRFPEFAKIIDTVKGKMGSSE